MDPLLEVFDNMGVRQAYRDLLSGSVTPCGEVSVEDIDPEPTDDRPVTEAVPAVVVAGAPTYTG